eukprot:TRINITY_DN4330_c1_g1_i2.p1 TRINITY_DN4330_c1_g1~~TRINITY_DN4330_c1_g1_i2.p1  ORF type:complete len:232 (+),score=-3.26 TRINITY_DN4330_c1_g1_i2:190-885(+)
MKKKISNFSEVPNFKCQNTQLYCSALQFQIILLNLTSTIIQLGQPAMNCEKKYAECSQQLSVRVQFICVDIFEGFEQLKHVKFYLNCSRYIVQQIQQEHIFSNTNNKVVCLTIVILFCCSYVVFVLAFASCCWLLCFENFNVFILVSPSVLHGKLFWRLVGLVMFINGQGMDCYRSIWFVQVGLGYCGERYLLDTIFNVKRGVMSRMVMFYCLIKASKFYSVFSIFWLQCA